MDIYYANPSDSSALSGLDKCFNLCRQEGITNIVFITQNTDVPVKLEDAFQEFFRWPEKEVNKFFSRLVKEKAYIFNGVGKFFYMTPKSRKKPRITDDYMAFFIEVKPKDILTMLKSMKAKAVVLLPWCEEDVKELMDNNINMINIA